MPMSTNRRGSRSQVYDRPSRHRAAPQLIELRPEVLLLIDASYGFELETFEFINILQVPGPCSDLHRAVEPNICIHRAVAGGGDV